MDGLHATMVGFRTLIAPSLARAGVTPHQFWVLTHLGESGDHACGPLASRLGVTPPSITVIVDSLVESGFVRRTRSTEDRRVVRTELTTKGSELLEGVWKELEREVGRRIQELSAQDVRSAARVLAVLGRRPDAAPRGPP
jgi:DNA-binding MarR family transcriptional regulator